MTYQIARGGSPKAKKPGDDLICRSKAPAHLKQDGFFEAPKRSSLIGNQSNVLEEGLTMQPLETMPRACTTGVRDVSPSPRPEVLFFGDPHGDFEFVVRTALTKNPKAIVLLGDQQATKPLHEELAPILHMTQVFCIPGNHDTDSDAEHDNLWLSDLRDRNLHARVMNVAGLQIAGLGGVFRESAWNPDAGIESARVSSRAEMIRHMKRGRGRGDRDLWRGGISRRHHATIFPNEYLALASKRADVLVTHEAPSVHRHGWRALDDLARKLGARLLIHGHHHECLEYLVLAQQQSDSRIRIYGVGAQSALEWPSGTFITAVRKGEQP